MKKINIKIQPKQQQQPQNLKVGGCWCVLDEMTEANQRFGRICEKYFANGI